MQAKAASGASWQTTPRRAETIRKGSTTEPANIRSIRSPAAVRMNMRHRKSEAIFVSGMPCFKSTVPPVTQVVRNEPAFSSPHRSLPA
jgi:hypothetical protein